MIQVRYDHSDQQVISHEQQVVQCTCEEEHVFKYFLMNNAFWPENSHSWTNLLEDLQNKNQMKPNYFFFRGM